MKKNQQVWQKLKKKTLVSNSNFAILFSFLEAVNLELININSKNNPKKPTNGKHNNDLPMKKDGDVETGETYVEEYFVPVNEHRKYMR